MSHHFDTPTALEDPRINLTDFYLFEGPAGRTVMALNVNPDAGLSAPDTFRDEEGLYAFRYDLNGDFVEDVAFKVMFGPVSHADGDEHKHMQTFEVRRSTKAEALKGFKGDVIAKGTTGQMVKGEDGVLAYAGLAPDLFAGDAMALGVFRNALKENKFSPEAFENRKNFFEKRNITTIVLEVPTSMIGKGRVHAWATVSLYGHAPEVQVSRWGLPLITNILIPDPESREIYNRVVPSEDHKQVAGFIGKFVEQATTLAGTASDPADYTKQALARLSPVVLPYELGTHAAFDYATFNGRALSDDVMDVVLSISTNSALGDGVAPDRKRIRDAFPYFGEPFNAREQADVKPARPAKK